MYPDSDAPYLGTFVKDTVHFFGTPSDVIYPGNKARERKYFFYASIYKLSICKIMRSKNVFVHFPLFFMPLILISRIIGKKTHIIYHGGEFMNRPYKWPGFNLVRTIIFHMNNALADSIYVPSHFVADVYFKRWRQKTKTWYSGGIDISSQPSPDAPRRFHFGYIGRREYVKGYDCLRKSQEALKYRLAEDADVHFLVVCRETKEPREEKLGGLTINYSPPLPHSEVKALLRECRFVVIPSRVESLCLLALEAASCGAVVIARKLPPIQETLSDRCIFFTEDDELAGILEFALSMDQASWSAMSQNLCSTAKKYNRGKLLAEFKL